MDFNNLACDILAENMILKLPKHLFKKDEQTIIESLGINKQQESDKASSHEDSDLKFSHEKFRSEKVSSFLMELHQTTEELKQQKK